MARDVRKFGPPLLQDAQKLPALREVAGEEEDDQDLDELDRLKSEEVDLRVAESRAGPNTISASDRATPPAAEYSSGG